MVKSDFSNNVPKKRLYSIKELVREIGATEWFWRTQIWNGQLPYVQVGRKMFVYRITQVNEDGIELDLTWMQIKRRCSELGLEVVPELHNGIIDADGNLVLDDYGYKDSEQFLYVVEQSTTGYSTLDYTHIREGVCVRLEKADGTIKVFKHKSFNFKVLEGILKNNDDYVDTEDVN